MFCALSLFEVRALKPVVGPTSASQLHNLSATVTVIPTASCTRTVATTSSCSTTAATVSGRIWLVFCLCVCWYLFEELYWQIVSLLHSPGRSPLGLLNWQIYGYFSGESLCADIHRPEVSWWRIPQGRWEIHFRVSDSCLGLGIRI